MTSRKKVGLALGSGGWRGLSHIGVLKVLVKNNIPIDIIAGCSAGSMVGGMYAHLLNIEKLEVIALGLRKRDILPAFSDPLSRSGLVKGHKALQVLEKYVGKVKIEELAIPFAAVTTDLISGEAFALKKGSLAKAMRASGSIPFVLPPVSLGTKKLVDGALSMPVPVQVAREMGADIVIAVNLYSDVYSKDGKPELTLTGLNVTRLSIYYALHNLSKRDVEDADIVIAPKMNDVGFGLLRAKTKNEGIIKKGEEAMQKELSGLKKLL